MHRYTRISVKSCKVPTTTANKFLILYQNFQSKWETEHINPINSLKAYKDKTLYQMCCVRLETKAAKNDKLMFENQ
jgi:hypothetical protein